MYLIGFSLPTAFRGSPKGFRTLPTAFRGLPKGFGTLPTAFRGLPKGFGTLPTAFRGPPKGFGTLPTAFRGPPKGFGTLPTAFRGLPKGYGDLPKAVGRLFLLYCPMRSSFGRPEAERVEAPPMIRPVTSMRQRKGVSLFVSNTKRSPAPSEPFSLFSR